jgi:hypothetical protein
MHFRALRDYIIEKILVRSCSYFDELQISTPACVCIMPARERETAAIYDT